VECSSEDPGQFSWEERPKESTESLEQQRAEAYPGTPRARKEHETALQKQLVELQSSCNEWREEAKRLEDYFSSVQRQLAEWRIKNPADCRRGLRSDQPVDNAERLKTLANALQILTCLKDVILPRRDMILPDDPHQMTQDQRIVYHFLNQVDTCNKEAGTVSSSASPDEHVKAHRTTRHRSTHRVQGISNTMVLANPKKAAIQKQNSTITSRAGNSSSSRKAFRDKR